MKVTQELLAILTLSVLRQALTCPEDPVTSVINCLFETAADGEKKTPLSGKDVDEVDRHCKNGGFITILKCVDDLYENCTSTDKRKLLDTFADHYKLNTTFKTFCRNFEVYRTNGQCIAQQESEIENCHILLSEENHITEDTIHGICRFFANLQQCGYKPVKQACGKEVAIVISDFLKGITPPICEGYILDNTESQSFHLTWSRLFINLSSILILSFIFVHFW